MATNKTRIKRTSTHVPCSIEEADIFVGLIGTSQSQIDLAEAETEKQIQKLREDLRKRTEKVRKDRNTLMTGLFAFASSRQDTLIESNGGKKTIELTNGSFGWRWTPPAVCINNDELFIAECKRMGFHRYIRVKEEVNREALLDARPRIPYLAFTQREEFVVKPANASDVVKTRTITLD